MKDMLGQKISSGDFFLIPGGNVRYGGLVLEVGIVLSMTEKRLKTLITRFDKIKLKPTTKTSTKVFKLPVNTDLFDEDTDLDEQELFYGNPAILALHQAFLNHEAHNGR
tara:strand:- start:92 stop:418 length:327 start_codon:yes stop_codon:yes gene_type:complete